MERPEGRATDGEVVPFFFSTRLYMNKEERRTKMKTKS
jgi:hypothetical protein